MLCNQGPLVEPLTKSTYQNGTGKKPLQLFSHSDQVGLFQTAIANTVSQTGWGGRLADKTVGLNGAATFPNNVSIAGVNLYLTGVDTRQLAVADANTSLANVLILSDAPSATASEISLSSGRHLTNANVRQQFPTDKSGQRHSFERDSNGQRLVDSKSGAHDTFPNTSLAGNFYKSRVSSKPARTLRRH